MGVGERTDVNSYPHCKVTLKKKNDFTSLSLFLPLEKQSSRANSVLGTHDSNNRET